MRFLWMLIGHPLLVLRTVVDPDGEWLDRLEKKQAAKRQEARYRWLRSRGWDHQSALRFLGMEHVDALKLGELGMHEIAIAERQERMRSQTSPGSKRKARR